MCCEKTALLCSRSRTQGRFKTLNVCLDSVFVNSFSLFPAKLNLVWWYSIMSQCQLSCKLLFCYLQAVGLIFIPYLELLILLQPNLVWLYIVLSWSVLRKDWIAVVKVTVMVWNFIVCLSVQFLYHYHSYLWNQTRCVDVLVDSYINDNQTLCKQISRERQRQRENSDPNLKTLL